MTTRFIILKHTPIMITTEGPHPSALFCGKGGIPPTLHSWDFLEPHDRKSGRPKAILHKPSDSLRIAARPARRPALFPQLFPIPQPGRHLDRQRKSVLMREHTHLPAMVGFVREHVAQHFHANRPGPSPAVSSKFLDAAPTAQRFSKHLRAASRALGQSRAGLLRRTVHAVELSRNFQMRSRKPDPLATGIVHVREDRCDGPAA